MKASEKLFFLAAASNFAQRWAWIEANCNFLVFNRTMLRATSLYWPQRTTDAIWVANHLPASIRGAS